MRLELDVTIQGLGGYMFQGQGGKRLDWLDDRGGVPWARFAGRWNFDLWRGSPYGRAAETGGSFLLSSPFDLKDHQELKVSASVITADFQAYWDVGFGLLVQGPTVQKVLFALRPDGSDLDGDVGPTVLFAAPSAGVVVNPVKQNVPANVVLGGVNYGDTTIPFHGTGYTDVSPVCTPGAGNYQLVFGMFNTGGDYDLANRPSALMVRSVEVI